MFCYDLKGVSQKKKIIGKHAKRWKQKADTVVARVITYWLV